LKKKPKYHHIGLGEIKGPPTDDRSMDGLGGVTSSYEVEEFCLAVLYDKTRVVCKGDWGTRLQENP